MKNRNIYQEDLEHICYKPIPFEKLKGKSVLITGANGLIGSCLTDVLMKLNELFSYNIGVFALCRNEKKAKNRFYYYEGNPLFELVIADVAQRLPDSLKCDYIIHAASNAHPMAYANEPVDTMKGNIIGTMQLLEYARVNTIQKLLFVSSSEVYGENINHLESYQEEDLGYLNSMDDRACYPESKRAAEALCVSYAKQYGINVSVARIGYAYGITMNESNTRADIQFFKRAVQGKDIIMKSDGMQKRSYCYLADVVSALLYILLLGKQREAYNIANKDSNVTIRDFATTLAAQANVTVIYENPMDIEQQGYSKIRNSVLNADKLRALGWEAETGLSDGIKRVFEGIKVTEGGDEYTTD